MIKKQKCPKSTFKVDDIECHHLLPWLDALRTDDVLDLGTGGIAHPAVDLGGGRGGRLEVDHVHQAAHLPASEVRQHTAQSLSG